MVLVGGCVFCQVWEVGKLGFNFFVISPSHFDQASISTSLLYQLSRMIFPPPSTLANSQRSVFRRQRGSQSEKEQKELSVSIVIIINLSGAVAKGNYTISSSAQIQHRNVSIERSLAGNSCSSLPAITEPDQQLGNLLSLICVMGNHPAKRQSICPAMTNSRHYKHVARSAKMTQ